MSRQPSPSSAAPGRARRLDRCLRVIAALLLVALSGALVEHPAGAAPSQAATNDPPRVLLRSQTAFVPPTGTFSLTLEIQHRPADALLGFSILYPLTNLTNPRGHFNETISGKGHDGLFQPGQPVPLDLLPVNADGTVRADLTIAPDSSPDSVMYQINEPGVYPLTVTLLNAARQELDRFTTFMVKLPPAAANTPALKVATIIGFHAPVGLQSDGSTTISADDRTRLRALTTLLRSHPSVPITLDPTPETIDALAATGAPANGGPTAEEVAGALSGREAMWSTYVDLDLDAWVRSGLGPELADQLSLGSTALRGHLHPAAGTTPATWNASTGLTPDALAKLRELGVGQLVGPDAAVSSPDPKVFDVKQLQVASLQPFEIDDGKGPTMRAVTSDQTLASRLTATDNPALNAQYAIADLALQYFGALASSVTTFEQRPRETVLAVPDDPNALPALDAFLGALDTPIDAAGGGRAIVQAATLADVLAVDPATVPRTNEPLVRPYRPQVDAEATMGAFPERLNDAHRLIDGYRSMVVDTDPTKVVQLDQFVRVSGAAGLTDHERQAYFDAVTNEVHAATGGITTRPQERITLTASDAQIPVQLDNGLPYPVQVRLVLETDRKLDFKNGSNVLTTLQPGPNKILIDVRVRSAGEFTLDLKVLSPDSNLELASTRYPVRSLVVSGIGLALTIGAGIFLLLWWSRHFRSARRARKLVTPTDGEGDADGHGTPSEPDPEASVREPARTPT